MKVFVDVNILVAALLKEKPLYDYAIRMLSLPRPKFRLYTSAVSLAIAFYFSSKRYGQRKAKRDIELLVQFLTITDCGPVIVEKAIANKKAEDFEDGLQYYSAIHESCHCIITEDLDDFYFSEIEVPDCSDFIKKIT